MRSVMYEMRLLFAIILPFLLVLYWIIHFYRKRSEQSSLILKLFLVGLTAVPVAGIIELIFLSTAKLFPEIWSFFTESFMGAVLMEESLKMSALAICTYHRKESDQVANGVIYGITVAIGFAVLENFHKILESSNPLETAWMRNITSVPLHTLTGGLMGLSWSRNQRRFKASLLGAIALAVLIHGLYNWIVFEQHIPSELIFFMLVGGWFFFILTFIKYQKRTLKS